MSAATGLAYCPLCELAGEVDGWCICRGSGALPIEEAEQLHEAAAELGTELPAIRVVPPPPAYNPEPCHDCAFRAGSPEREDGPAFKRLLRKIRQGEPFYCHQGMLVGAGDRYLPLVVDGQGRPVDHPLCAGAVAAAAAWAEREVR